MKKVVMSIVAAILLITENLRAEINCATLPTCSQLGYTEAAGSCRGKYNVCPFDVSKVTCIDSPAVGDIKYSLRSSNHDGWLLCDGTQYSTSTYSKLYGVINTNFCRKYTSKSNYTSACSSGKFAVPDYRGFFLRGVNNYNASSNTVGAPSSYYGYAFNYMSGNYNTSSYAPQYEQLPEIYAYLSGGTAWEYQFLGDSLSASGAFSLSGLNQKDGIDKGGSGYGAQSLTFRASSYNSIYGGSHVIPANYGAYIFIYAGQ